MIRSSVLMVMGIDHEPNLIVSNGRQNALVTTVTPRGQLLT